MTSKKAGCVFFLAVLLHIVMVLILAVVGAIFPVVYDLYPSTLIAQGAFFLPMLIFALCTPAYFSEMFPFKRIRVGTVFLSLLVLVLIYPLISLVNGISLLFTENATQTLVTDASTTPMWQMILLLGLIAPFIEECTFRGYIFGCLRSSGRKKTAIFFSALLFGLIHLNVNQFSYTFVMGLFLAMMTEAAGSLWPALLMHVCFNIREVVGLYTVQTETDEAKDALSTLLAGNGWDTEWESLVNFLANVSPVVLLVMQVLAAVVGTVLAVLLVRATAGLEKKARTARAAKAAGAAAEKNTASAAVKETSENAGDTADAGKESRQLTGESCVQGAGMKRKAGPVLNLPLLLGILLAAGYMTFNELILMQY